MDSEIWTVAKAKAKFSEVIDRALTEGPQIISRHGRNAVVVVASEEWERKTRRTGNLAEFFAATSEVHELTLVTRNASHFDPLLKAVINPWNGT